MEEFNFSTENEFEFVAKPSEEDHYDAVFTVHPDMAKKIEDNFWKKRKKHIHLKGFRKGHVPRAVAEKRSIGGRDGFYAAIFQEYANIKAVDDSPQKVILTNDHQAHKNDETGEWDITFKLWLEPEVELKDDFESIKMKTQKLEKGDYVEKKIAAFAKVNPYLHTKASDDGGPLPSEEGDMVEVSIAAFADDEPYPDGSEEATNIRLLPDAVKPQSLYDKLIGVKPGDGFTINVDSIDTMMPHFQRELEGKKFRMDVKVNYVYRCEEPKIDDDLAITAGYESMEDWQKALNDSADMIIKGEDMRTKRALLISYTTSRANVSEFPDEWAAFKATELLQSRKVVGTLDEIVRQIKSVFKQNLVLKAVGEKLGVEWDDADKSRYQRNEEAYANKVLELLLEKTEFEYVDLGNDEAGGGDRENSGEREGSTPRVGEGMDSAVQA